MKSLSGGGKPTWGQGEGHTKPTAPAESITLPLRFLLVHGNRFPKLAKVGDLVLHDEDGLYVYARGPRGPHWIEAQAYRP